MVVHSFQRKQSDRNTRSTPCKPMAVHSFQRKQSDRNTRSTPCNPIWSYIPSKENKVIDAISKDCNKSKLQMIIDGPDVLRTGYADELLHYGKG